MPQAIVIIPCKMDSTRLLNKNLRKIEGKTLLEYAITYAHASKYTAAIIVSTEADEVKDICANYPYVTVHNRPKHLLEDADTVDVYVNVMQLHKHLDSIKKMFPPYDLIPLNMNNIFQSVTHIIGLQPDNPDRGVSLDDIIDYFVSHKYDDLVTVGKDGTRNGSVRIIKAEFVRENNVSRRIGTLLDDCTNIHTEEDLKIATKNILNG